MRRKTKLIVDEKRTANDIPTNSKYAPNVKIKIIRVPILIIPENPTIVDSELCIFA